MSLLSRILEEAQHIRDYHTARIVMSNSGWERYSAELQSGQIWVNWQSDYRTTCGGVQMVPYKGDESYQPMYKSVYVFDLLNEEDVYHTYLQDDNALGYIEIKGSIEQ